MTDDNPALTRPKPNHPPTPWELTLERDDLAAAASLAMAVMGCEDVPDWLRDRASETADDIGWWLTFGEDAGPRSVRLVPALMSWQGAYQEYTTEFLLDLSDKIKAAYPLDVILAEKCAIACDTVGFSIDARMETLEILNRTLGRLKDHADADDELDDDSEQFERSTNHGAYH